MKKQIINLQFFNDFIHEIIAVGKYRFFMGLFRDNTKFGGKIA